MKHTPSPWTTDNEVVGWWNGEQPGCMVRFWTGNTGHPIANCLSRDTGEATIANARLIAAAPELLEALKGVLINPAIQGTHYAARIEALIKKAEGGN